MYTGVIAEAFEEFRDFFHRDREFNHLTISSGHPILQFSFFQSVDSDQGPNSRSKTSNCISSEFFEKSESGDFVFEIIFEIMHFSN